MRFRRALRERGASLAAFSRHPAGKGASAWGMSAYGTEQTSMPTLSMSALGGEAEVINARSIDR